MPWLLELAVCSVFFASASWILCKAFDVLYDCWADWQVEKAKVRK